jgi:hypothetical protein
MPNPPVPLQPLEPSELAHRLNQPGTSIARVTREPSENEKRAGRELGMISELQSSTAFKWFFEKCVEQAFFEARERLFSEDTPESELLLARERYQAIKKIVRWIKEREIEHRRCLNKDDSGLPRLREELKRFS